MSKLVKELLPVGVTLLGIGYLVFNWAALPEVVPIHFGLLGQPDGFAPKLVICGVPLQVGPPCTVTVMGHCASLLPQTPMI